MTNDTTRKQKTEFVGLRLPVDLADQLPNQKRGEKSQFIISAVRHYLETDQGRSVSKRPHSDVLDELKRARYEVNSIGVNLNQVAKLLWQQEQGATADLRPGEVKEVIELVKGDLETLRNVIEFWKID